MFPGITRVRGQLSPLAIWIGCAVIALPPALLAIFQLGRLHPDELFQYLEPALHRSFGFGILAWEWKEGLRNWAIPGVFAGLLSLCRALGIEHPQARRAVLELPQYLLHVWMLHSVYLLCARRVHQGAPLLGPLLVGTYGLVWHFAGRTLGESFSAAFLVLAAERLDLALCTDGGGSPSARSASRAAVAGGLLLGLSVVARYSSAVFVAAMLIWLVFTRRLQLLLRTVLGGSAVALALAGLDYWTWGRPLHSLFAYAQFNLLSDGAAHRFGASGPETYLHCLVWMAPWTLVGVAGELWRRRSGHGSSWVASLLWSGLAYVALLMVTPHKEQRFLYPAFVAWAVATLPPTLHIISRIQLKSIRWLCVAVLLAAGQASFVALSPFHVQRPAQFRITVKAGSIPGASGVIVFGEGLWGSGGSFYLGKDIPWRISSPRKPGFRALSRNPRFNRAITWNDLGRDDLERAGFQLLHVDGKASLFGR